jgi:hypothetical protein
MVPTWPPSPPTCAGSAASGLAVAEHHVARHPRPVDDVVLGHLASGMALGAEKAVKLL